jgi:exonuclease VII small subunit
MVGNADNTSDLNKPVSNYQTALDLKAPCSHHLQERFQGTSTMVGISNVDNTSDLQNKCLLPKTL